MPEDKLSRSLKAASGEKAKGLGGLTPPKPDLIGNVAKALDPSAHRTATTKATQINDQFDYDTAMHFAFVGAGQGGSRIAQAFWNIGYRRVGIFNTTANDFDGLSPEIPKLSLDIGGAAKDMQLARQALVGRDEDLWDLFTRSWGTQFDCVLVCVGLGGGSGSGSALPLVRTARKYMAAKNLPERVGAIVSLPGTDEGQQVARNAVTAFNELLTEKVSPLIVIDNDRVHTLYQPSMAELLPKSNHLVSELLHLFNKLAAAKSKHITFDRSEFAQILDSGLCVFGAADIGVEEINSPADVSAKIRDHLAESVLAQVDLRTGKKAACVFVASDAVLDTFSKDYFSAGFEMLNRIVGQAHPDGTNVIVHRGLYQGGEDGLQCYTMIGELDAPAVKLQALAKQAGLRTGAGGVARHLRVE